MAKLVVDSSIAIKWFLPEPLSDRAARILESYRDGALLLLAPDLIHAEVGNILWKTQRTQMLDSAEAQRVIAAFREVALVLTPSASLLEEAHRLAVAHQRTVYDALYLALSLREQCPFVTADDRLVHAVASALPNVVALADWG